MLSFESRYQCASGVYYIWPVVFGHDVFSVMLVEIGGHIFEFVGVL